MKCENREEKISLYIDRQLEWKEEKEFLKHMKECPECKEALQQAQQIRQMLLEMPMEEVPEGLHENIVKAIEKEMQLSPTKSKKRIAWQKYGAMAATFLVLIGGSYFYSTTRPHSTTTTDNTAEIASMQLSDTMAEAQLETEPQCIEESSIESAGIEPQDMEQEQYNAVEEVEQSPIITQTRSANAPETAKSLPATPNLGAGFTRDNKTVAKGEEAAEAAEIAATEQAEQKQNDNEDVTVDTAITRQSEEQQSVLTQPVADDKKVQNDKGKEEDTEQAEIGGENNDNVISSVRRSIPANMKSKSLQISFKTKQAEALAKNIEKRVKSLQGEIETPYKKEQNSMTIKIAATQYNDVVNWLGQQCEVTDRNEIVEDLAKQYREIQQQLDTAKAKEKQAEQNGQSRKAQEARKTQKECEKALEELQKTADNATIHITFVE